MKLRSKLSTDAWEKLSPAIQECYAQDGDSYVLQLDGREKESSDGELKRALERVKAERDEFKTNASDLARKLEEIDTVDARKRGDIDKLTEQWEKRLVELEQTKAQETAALRQHIAKTTLDNIVNTVATRNTSSKEAAALLDPHLRSQLTVEFDESGPVVKQADGTPFDLDNFEKSVVDNPVFSAIIVKNRASGGDAADFSTSSGQGGAFSTENAGNGGKTPLLAEISPKELAARLGKK